MIAPGSDLAAALGTATAMLAASPTPRLDAEVLLAHVLGTGRTYLVTWPERRLSATDAERYAACIDARAGGMPVAHLTGSREFWSLDLRVTPHTLVPRPETELLVALALAALPAGGRLLDLGTGTGAIALAVAGERPDAHVDAVERNEQTLAIAAVNRRMHRATNLYLHAGDWFEPVRGRRYDVITANPPYVAEDDPALATGDVRFEPRAALAAGADGTADLAAIAAAAPPHLAAGGRLLLEHGWQQGADVRRCLRESGFTAVATHRDFQGHERVSEGRRDDAPATPAQ